MVQHESKNRSAKLIIFGEVLYDCFPDGRRVLGGAPFNVAWSLKGFKRDPLFVSSVGDDSEGREITSHMRAWGLSTDSLQINKEHHTGEVHVTIVNDEPTYEICEDRAWDYIEDDGITGSGLIYHGLLALRNQVTQDTLRQIVERSDAIRFFDINLRPPYVDWDVLKSWIHGVDWLKLNINELRTLLDQPGIQFSDAKASLIHLRESYSINNVLLTGGHEGAIIHGAYGMASQLPAPSPATLLDTVGAGDAFSAATIDGILAGRSAQQIVASASLFAARVCEMRGATAQDSTFYQLNYE